MIELEYKFQIDESQHRIISDRLVKAGYKPSKRTYEKTEMYDNDTQLMQTTDGRIRVRTIGKGLGEFSYKKPIPTATGPKKEIEYQVEIHGEIEYLSKILNEMKFNLTTSYERYRTKYKKENKKTLITIDEFPFAIFVEIEGEKNEIKKIANLLGFDVKQHINKACDTLFTEWRSQRGLPMKPNMLFKDYDK